MVIVGLPLHLVVDFAIALLLSTRLRGLSIFRTIFYLPSITPIVATAVLWAWLLNSQYGPINAPSRRRLCIPACTATLESAECVLSA